MDRYKNFSELSKVEQEGIDFRVSVIHRVGFNTVVVSPHGGSIEPGTSEVAKKIAKNDLSLGIFDGRKSIDNAYLHITSTNFDEPSILDIVQKSDYVVTIHGEKSNSSIVFIGGRDNELIMHIQISLENSGYSVMIHENKNLRGMATTNICNRGRRRKGVQLELSAGLRQEFFDSLSSEGRRNPKDKLNDFAGAVREGLHIAGALKPQAAPDAKKCGLFFKFRLYSEE